VPRRRRVHRGFPAVEVVVDEEAFAGSDATVSCSVVITSSFRGFAHLERPVSVTTLLDVLFAQQWVGPVARSHQGADDDVENRR
jgi:hypothetical protein